MKHLIHIVSTFSLVLLVACASSKLRSGSPLFHNRWVLSELNGAPVQISGTSKDASLQFTYSGMKVTGNGGCNEITGTFTAQSDDLSFGPITSTRTNCADSKFEESFLATIAKVNRYEISNNELLLKKDKTVVAKFMAR